jgi:hypothetical protein
MRSHVFAERPALVALLLISLALNIVPVWWGLPTVDDKSWALDELSPDHLGLKSSERHRGRYPPLHYDLLRANYKPIRYLDARGVLHLSDSALRGVLQTIGRLLSSFMATGTVFLIYLTARRLIGRPGPLIAAAIVAFSAPFVFYAKTIKLEAPYLFWFALALYFFVRALAHHRLADYLGFGAAMTLSICTKDQAFALYVLPVLWLVADMVRHRRDDPIAKGSIFKSMFDRRLVWSGLLSVTLFVLIHRLLFGLDDFLHHLAFMRGPGARGWREYEMTWPSQSSMLWQAVKHTAFAMSWPAFAASIIGLGVVFVRRREEKPLLGLLLFPISYYLFFIVVAQFHYVRFLLPVALVLSLFSARALIVPLKVASLKVAASIVIVVVLLLASRRSLSLDLQMVHDSRYAVEIWLDENSGDDQKTLLLGSRSQIGQRSGLSQTRLETAAQRPLPTLRTFDAEFLVLNELEPANGKQRNLVTDLHAENLNYSPAYQPRYKPWVGALNYRGIRTNLNTVNPPLTVFERSAEWGLTDEEIQQRLVSLLADPADSGWAEVATAIATTPVLDRRSRLGPHLTTFGLTPDGWTRGTQAAALVIFKRKRFNARVTLALSCGAGPEDLPLKAFVVSENETVEVTFEEPGRKQVTLSAIPPGSQEIFVIFTDREWSSPTARSRRLGVKVKPLRLRRARVENRVNQA